MKDRVHDSHSSGMVNLKELCLISGKAAWMAYLNRNCLTAQCMLIGCVRALAKSVDNTHFLELAVEDFNLCQSIQHKELKQLERMTNGIPPNALSYSILIQGLCRGKNLVDAADFCV
ncbi:hypothetical protein IFM89_021554 [Coptis chinensis]|uniref:Pentatricopeptide repeat-containing protein n=1 Tax=Coptis chinensis TaxID=261450 RepID=A0A835IBJ6_9MAGN|nr:hypothetical protein IFM89_021554 [Coptis chinensis]